MTDLQMTTFNDIHKLPGRPIILFGSGHIAKKTLLKVDEDSVEFIVDNSTNLQGESYLEFPIRPPDEISEEHFVIITSTAIVDISQQLQDMGLSPQDDFVISPILNDRISISELERVNTEFYFTSGAMSASSEYGKEGHSKYGGGLFKCEVDGLQYSYEQIYEGPCYGSIRHGERILLIDTDNGLLEFADGEVTKVTELPSDSRPHGISYNKANGHFYIACSYNDSVLELNDSYSIVRKFEISDKIEYTGEAVHHCNDCLAIDNSLFVTMFSSSGNWKYDSFDGCIAEFNIATGERLTDVRSDFWMPHNIDMYNGSIHVLDSLSGELRYNNLTVQGSFPGFSRGLDYQDGLYYVGQSKNRNHSKVIGTSKTVSIDCGVVLFDPGMGISRTLHFPDVGGIHSITC